VTAWLPLYARSRRLPASAAVSAGVVLAIGQTWSLTTPGGEVHPSLAVLTVTAAAVPFVRTLAATDPALEKTAAMPWPPRRLLHLIAVAVFVTGVLILSQLLGTDFGPAAMLTRNAAGMIGLLGLGAALVGAGYAWHLPVVWTAMQCFLFKSGGSPVRQGLFWLVQEPGSRPAAITAGVLFLAGAIAYAARFGPPVPASEAPLGQNA